MARKDMGSFNIEHSLLHFTQLLLGRVLELCSFVLSPEKQPSILISTDEHIVSLCKSSHVVLVACDLSAGQQLVLFKDFFAREDVDVRAQRYRVEVLLSNADSQLLQLDLLVVLADLESLVDFA